MKYKTLLIFIFMFSVLVISANEGNIELINVIKNQDIKSVRKLINLGKNINEKDNNNWTPIMHSAWIGDSKITDLLIKNNANTEENNNNGWSLLMIYSGCGSLKEIKKIIKNTDVNYQSKDGKNALMLAAKNNHIEVIQYLIEQKVDISLTDNNGKNALHYAVFGNNLESVHKLAENGIDVNSKDKFGNTPLINLLITNNEPDPDIFFYLISKDANPKISNNTVLSALNYLVNKKNENKNFEMILNAYLKNKSLIKKEIIKTYDIHEGTTQLDKLKLFQTELITYDINQKIIQKNIDGDSYKSGIYKYIYKDDKLFQVRINNKNRDLINEYKYDKKGNLIKFLEFDYFDYNGNKNYIGDITIKTFEYNNNNQLIFEERKCFTGEYKEKIFIFFYNNNNNDFYKCQQPWSMIRYSYDKKGNLIYTDADTCIGCADREETIYQYDDDNKLLKKISIFYKGQLSNFKDIYEDIEKKDFYEKYDLKNAEIYSYSVEKYQYDNKGLLEKIIIDEKCPSRNDMDVEIDKKITYNYELF